ncbi:MAG: porin [Alphaproteobacteria bacterium]
MKNIFRNAALLSASLFALNAAAEGAVSQGPTLSLGGSITAAGVGVNQSNRRQPNPREVNFVSKGNLVVNVGGTSNNGLGYGAMAVLELDRAKGESDRVKELYVYTNGDSFGNVKIGDTEGIVQTMMYSGTDVLGGLGGAGGDLKDLINVTRHVDIRPGIAAANDKATKLVWVSPEMKGFQIGLDFTPSTKLNGKAGRGLNLSSNGDLKSATGTPYARNLMGAGLSYNKAFANYNVGLYLVGHTGKTRNDQTNQAALISTDKFHDTKGYQVGALIDYQNWQIGASYWDNNKSAIRYGGQNAQPRQTHTKGFDAAVAYDFAKNANVGIGYTQSRRKVQGGDAKSDVITATMDYVVAPGWVAFAEVDHFTLKAPAVAIADGNLKTNGGDIFADRSTVATNNHGTALMIGTKLRF